MPIPESHEAAPYYFKYIEQVPSGDVVDVLQSQFDETLALLSGISEERSLHRYAPDKWSFRQVINHVNDCERLFVFRAFWFARGFDSPLPSFEEKISAAGARADEFSWASHVEEFRGVRLSTLGFFRNLPAEAWTRSGTASEMLFTVNALAYLAAGHHTHHLTILRERYL
jgi:hypothetical protein